MTEDMTHTDEGQTKTYVVKRPGGLDLWPLKQLEAPAARQAFVQDHATASESSDLCPRAQLTIQQNFCISSLLNMKTAACLAAILGSAAAFAPAQTGKASTALRAFEDEVRKI